MSDTTPVTDDAIRRAHEWCDLHWPTDENRTPMADVIRHYRATVPAPPATLADELREVADRWYVVGDDSHQTMYGFADRVEAIEKENRDMERELNNAWGERDEAQHELDEAQADLRDVRNLLDQLVLGLSG